MSAARVRHRTAFPGVYARGTRFSAMWRGADGKQHNRSFRTIEEAVAFRTHMMDRAWEERDQRRRDSAERVLGLKAPKRGTIASAYSHVRRAAQEADRADVSTEQRPEVRRALTALYEAEETLMAAQKAKYGEAA